MNPGKFKPTEYPWSKAVTFKEWVIQAVESGQTKTPEFQAALNFYGRKRFEEIWREHVKAKKDGGSNGEV